MTSMLLLVQFASQNVAFFCCALFAGAATYISLVEHPTVVGGGTKLLDAYILASHPRPAILQGCFGLIGSVAGMLAGLAGGAIWWLAGGIVLGAAALLHVFVVMPLTRRCLDIDPRVDPKNAVQVFAKLVKLHAALSLAGLASLFMFITKV